MIPKTSDTSAVPATLRRADEAPRTKPLPKLDLTKPIEVAPSPGGSGNDTSGIDKPPKVGDPGDFSALL
jgi:hypothetical protein